MKERGIIFTGAMVRAILSAKNPKTQTRRLIKFPEYLKGETPGVIYEDGGGNWIGWDRDVMPNGHRLTLAEFTKRAYPNGEGFPCPYGKPGDRLYVRENHYRYTGCAPAPPDWIASPDGDPYKAICYDDDRESLKAARRAAAALKVPSILMPRWASRITLEVVTVRAERLHQITEEDAKAEGIQRDIDGHFICADGVHESAAQAFACLWDEINGKKAPWSSNPWVWVVEFRRLEDNER